MKPLYFILIALFYGMFDANGQTPHLFGEYRVGLISNEQPFVLIYEGQGTSTPVIDTLFPKEFFQFRVNDSTAWFDVYKMWNTSGFIHKSTIRDLKNLKEADQVHLLDSILDQETYLYEHNSGQKAYRQNESAVFHEEKFTPVLDLFIHNMIHSYDEKLMRKFIDLLLIESSSADESPLTALGYIYEARHEEVIRLLKSYNNMSLIEGLEFGFENVASQGAFNYETLRNQIQELKDAIHNK